MIPVNTHARTHARTRTHTHTCTRVRARAHAYARACAHARAHAHTHTFNRPFPGLPRWASTRKVKPIWILLEQEIVSGSGISWATCKSAPHSRQMTTPAVHHSVFTGLMPFLPPNQQRQSTEGCDTWKMSWQTPGSLCDVENSLMTAHV